MFPEAVDKLVALFEPFMPQILEAQGIPYSTDDVKKTISVAELEPWSAMLCDAMNLDPRGAFFSQSDCEQALDVLCKKSKFTAKCERAAVSHGCSVDECTPANQIT